MPPRQTNINKKKPSAKNVKNNNNNKSKGGGSSDNNEINNLLQTMPLARSVYQQDLPALEQIIQSSLPNNNNSDDKKQPQHVVKNLKLEQTVGEAFTGGRSTPVYQIQCEVTNTKTGVVKERFFIVKLIFMPGPENQGETSLSILQKRESYAVERRFYDKVAPNLRKNAGLAIPKLLTSDHNGSQALPIACWLMTSLCVQYPLHPNILDASSHMIYAMDWLAQFHAYSWNKTNSDDDDEWRRALWERGGFWNKKTPHDGSTAIKSSWLSTCQWLSKNHPSYASANTKALASRFQALSPSLAHFMAKQSKSSWSTMIHGDYKAANLFFRIIKEGEEEEEGTAAAIDFQYTGAGVPAEDLAYLLFPDAYISYWDVEESLLQHYYSKLIDCLVMSNKGGPSSLPFQSFLGLYKLSRVEMIIHWLSKGWVACTIGDAKLVSAIQETLDQIDGGCALKTDAEYRNALEKMVGICN